jgi:hypothetical protein
MRAGMYRYPDTSNGQFNLNAAALLVGIAL